mgnify:CR=1 FL=1
MPWQGSACLSHSERGFSPSTSLLSAIELRSPAKFPRPCALRSNLESPWSNPTPATRGTLLVVCHHIMQQDECQLVNLRTIVMDSNDILPTRPRPASSSWHLPLRRGPLPTEDQRCIMRGHQCYCCSSSSRWQRLKSRGDQDDRYCPRASIQG